MVGQRIVVRSALGAHVRGVLSETTRSGKPVIFDDFGNRRVGVAIVETDLYEFFDNGIPPPGDGLESIDCILCGKAEHPLPYGAVNVKYLMYQMYRLAPRNLFVHHACLPYLREPTIQFFWKGAKHMQSKLADTESVSKLASIDFSEAGKKEAEEQIAYNLNQLDTVLQSNSFPLGEEALQSSRLCITIAMEALKAYPELDSILIKDSDVRNIIQFIRQTGAMFKTNQEEKVKKSKVAAAKPKNRVKQDAVLKSKMSDIFDQAMRAAAGDAGRAKLPVESSVKPTSATPLASPASPASPTSADDSRKAKLAAALEALKARRSES